MDINKKINSLLHSRNLRIRLPIDKKEQFHPLMLYDYLLDVHVLMLHRTILMNGHNNHC